MERLLSNLKISVPEKIYKKDPQSSELGRRIIEHSILLIDEIGFEAYTFKKLGKVIASNESSIYRYFESKHHILLYLSSWYWSWKEYQLVIETFSLNDPKEKLEKAINILTRTVKKDTNFTHINEVILNRIIINENSKSFLTKEVDKENQEGLFVVYKRIVSRLKEMIIAVDKEYQFPASLASTIVEGGIHQHFLKDHFNSITDCNKTVTPSSFFTQLTFSTLNYT
jgi:AcrR family transcriptional regulator